MSERDKGRGPANTTMQFQDSETAAEQQATGHNLDSLLDVRIPVTAEVGGTELTLQAILDLVPGSVVPLDKRVDEALDLCVNGKLVARGEIVSLDGSYALRITEIVDPHDRLETLR